MEIVETANFAILPNTDKVWPKNLNIPALQKNKSIVNRTICFEYDPYGRNFFYTVILGRTDFDMQIEILEYLLSKMFSDTVNLINRIKSELFKISDLNLKKIVIIKKIKSKCVIAIKINKCATADLAYRLVLAVVHLVTKSLQAVNFLYDELIY